MGAGAFCRDFTINVSPQCKAFSRALQTKKLKAPLFPGPDWCIMHMVTNFNIYQVKRKHIRGCQILSVSIQKQYNKSYCAFNCIFYMQILRFTLDEVH